MAMRRGAAWGAATMTVLSAIVLAGCTGAPTAEATRTRTPSPTPTAACIVGTWKADAAQLQALYDAIPADLDYPPATLAPTSSVVVAFDADGGFVFTQDVPTTLTWEGHAAAVALGGSMTGTYRASGTSIALTAKDDALTVTPSDTSTASTVFAAATQVTLDEWPVSATTFSCAGDALRLGLQTEGHPATVAFTRG
jgi:hypothetical protein